MKNNQYGGVFPDLFSPLSPDFDSRAGQVTGLDKNNKHQERHLCEPRPGEWTPVSCRVKRITLVLFWPHPEAPCKPYSHWALLLLVVAQAQEGAEKQPVLPEDLETRAPVVSRVYRKSQFIYLVFFNLYFFASPADSPGYAHCLTV